MEIVYSEEALKDLKSFDKQLQKYFISHLEKLAEMPPRRHLRRGLPMYVETVTRQARFVYKEEGSALHVIRCFATHKEYERWYGLFR